MLHLSPPATRILSKNAERAVLLCQFANNYCPLDYTSCTVDVLFTKEWLLYVYPFDTCILYALGVHMDCHTHQVSKKQHHKLASQKHNLAIKRNTPHA